ncbi:GTPase-associated system all-helical protein GASH [Tunturiibacter lichenicola]|uniref:GTPase-associated system all-helical protein GASH n=1 Tax=Tunturiibacter lichenicola TaxID=2051959 RepID=UPI003D9ACFDD
MLDKGFEFIRVADLQPSSKKVKLRIKSASDLLKWLAADEAKGELLPLIQGVITGFDSGVFNQDSTVVIAILKSIKDEDTAFPVDLKENALELRAVAAIAIGELLEKLTTVPSSKRALLAGLAISAAELIPASTEQHVRWMQDTLRASARKGLALQAIQRRKRATPLLDEFGEFELSEDAATDNSAVTELLPVLKSALREAKAQAIVDREEIETLWWMFGAFSEIEQKPFSKVEPAAVAALAAGRELAQRSLIPPSSAAPAMIERMVGSDRKPETLAPATLQDIASKWPSSSRASFVSAQEKANAIISRCPSLFPVSWACRRLQDSGDFGKDFALTTGITADVSLSPAEWGAQVFREAILSRFLTGVEES